MSAAGSDKLRHIRVAFVGWGAVARRVAQLVASDARIAIVAIAVRNREKVRHDLPAGAVIVSDPRELENIDILVEAAGWAIVERWGEAAMILGADYVVCSASAFTDPDLLDRLVSLASVRGHQIIVPHCAIAGIDGLAAASALDLAEVVHVISKPPAAWKGTDAEQLLDLDRLETAQTFFSGSAREAAAQFPQNANAAVVTSLAGMGLDKTSVRLVADPGLARNMHEISATGAFGQLTTRIENEPLATNVKSSEMTALSVARLLQKRVFALVV